MAARVVASFVLASLLFLAGRALADPIFTSKGKFVENAVKTTLTLGKTPGGTPVNTQAMVLETLKPGGQKKDIITHVAPWVEPTPAEAVAINAGLKATFTSIVVVSDPNLAYNCHGLTFKDRKVSIDNTEVQKIIDDQGWKPPEGGKAKVGDIVIYRKHGDIKHSGIVKEVDAAGAVKKVQSKWGPQGEYVHDPTDVPAEYGAMEVLTGGAPLQDPPPSDDLSVFEFIEPVFLKPDLVFETLIDVMPWASMDLVGDPGGVFDYFLNIPDPDVDLRVAPNDTLTVYARGIMGASVTGAAADALFGGWVVDAVSQDFARWRATTAALLAADVFGFSLNSRFSEIGEAFFREEVAGSLGRTKGPIAEPPILALLGLALTIAAHRLRRPARR